MSNNHTRKSLGRVVARRELVDGDNAQRKVIIALGMPRRELDSGRDEWECPFLIEGAGESKVQRAHGVDAFQALLIAIQGIRLNLDRTGRRLHWLDSQLGAKIPRYIPTDLGAAAETRIGLAIEREKVRHWRSLIKREKAKLCAAEARMKREGASSREIIQMLAKKRASLENWETEVNSLKSGWSFPSPSE